MPVIKIFNVQKSHVNLVSKEGMYMIITRHSKGEHPDNIWWNEMGRIVRQAEGWEPTEINVVDKGRVIIPNDKISSAVIYDVITGQLKDGDSVVVSEYDGKFIVKKNSSVASRILSTLRSLWSKK